MAISSIEIPPGLIGLPAAARRLDVDRATVNHMVHRGRLPARRIGPHWYIDEAVLEEFAATYQPPRHRRTKHPTNQSRDQVARLLVEWREATAEELAVGVGLHPGNVRKHLVILEAAGVAERDDQAFWRLTEPGRRLYEGNAKAS